MSRLLWLLCFPLEAVAGWILLEPAPGKVAVSLALHVVAAGLFGLSFGPGAGGRGWSMLGWTLSLLVFPMFGMLAVAAAFVTARAARWRRRNAVGEIEAAVEGEERAGDVIARARTVEVSLLEEREVEPVVDVLQEEDPEAKRAAIEELTKRRDAEAVRLLRNLLHDPSPEARLFASLALSRLEDEIGKEILAARRELDAAPGSPELEERLGDLCLEYALSGFLEGPARDHYLELAREAFEGAMESGDGSLPLRLARVHLMLGEIAEAARLLDELSRRHPDDAEVRLLRMEVIYEFGDFRELSVYARRALPSLPEDSGRRPVVAWWAGEEEAEAAGAL